ncbi:hypothetical protein DM02DRAFT_660169 [Periconia macrospinosa]|uniref:Uncharacterized protein n=1 Tax=Periconia macrospinosa TaxID=97972 RepID=A0A2V1DBC2_9PLEO|nr:hypothetical protein DM02DRAFT_660169 [Periconia macrospinosa]
MPSFEEKFLAAASSLPCGRTRSQKPFRGKIRKSRKEQKRAFERMIEQATFAAFERVTAEPRLRRSLEDALAC